MSLNAPGCRILTTQNHAVLSPQSKCALVSYHSRGVRVCRGVWILRWAPRARRWDESAWTIKAQQHLFWIILFGYFCRHGMTVMSGPATKWTSFLVGSSAQASLGSRRWLPARVGRLLGRSRVMTDTESFVVRLSCHRGSSARIHVWASPSRSRHRSP